MLEKLKSVLKIHTFPLLAPAIKALVFSGLLFLSAEKKNPVFFALFLFFALHFYFRKLLEWRKFFYTFLVLIIFSLIAADFFTSKIFLIIASLFFGVLFFLLLGIKNFVFINRETFFSFLYWLLYVITAIVFFVADKSEPLGLTGLAVLSFFSFYLLFKESLDFAYSEAPRKKRSLLALSSSFLVIQAAFVIRWLPLNFLSAAVMTTLIIIVLEDLISYHLKGELDRQIIIKNVIVLGSLALLILLTLTFL